MRVKFQFSPNEHAAFGLCIDKQDKGGPGESNHQGWTFHIHGKSIYQEAREDWTDPIMFSD